MRTLHRLYAWLFGYFWIPCPVCGRMFGGHERGGRLLPTSDPHIYKITCPACGGQP